MAIQQKVYTVEDLWELSGQPQGRIPKSYELVKGELREMAPASGMHGGFANDFSYYVTGYVKEHKLGYVTAAETGYILFTDPVEGDTVRAPDVGYVAKGRLPDGLPASGYIPLAPDLAIEVASPSESGDDIEEKIRDYLRAGTRMIVYFYPKTRTLTVITPTSARRLTENDTLDGGDVLPGFTLPLKLLFEKP